ncbi:MAG TPA: hypothetical protein VNQ76_08825 [Planctomicrobium sp.]|nr:hypothetical protein [Planctomicrobium sp.]
MREQEALELIDAHLDDDDLSEEQITALADWLRENPQHAQRAFHRIFLHSFLRRRLQAQRLSTSSTRTDLVPGSTIEPSVTAEQFSLQLMENTAVAGKFTRRRSVLLLGGLLLCLALLAWGGFMYMYSTNPTVEMATAYDGFDYPATSIPAPLPQPQTWPNTGGMQGLSGGIGWAEPWQETGAKVAVIVDHTRELNWDPKDMRKFKPLGHTDTQGRVLQTTGLQMRTAMGIRSLTSRKLDLTAFPESMIDESGLGKDGTVLWFSFLAQSFNSTAENNRFTYFQIGSREISGFRIGKVGAAPSGNWTATGLLTGAQVNLRSSSVPSGEMAFLVTRLEFRPGPEDAAVWINPSLAAEPKLAEATLRLSVPDFRFDGITINANYSTDIDEIRIGPSFRAVAPSVP